MQILFKDKYMPHQKAMSNLYVGTNFEKDAYDFISEYSDIIDPYEMFKIEVPEEFSQEEMGSNPINLSFFYFLVSVLKPKNILEIGTFVGAATMVFASISERVITIEKYKKFADIALRNFKNNEFNNIELINDDALKVVSKLDDKFDLVFIDGNKENYFEYFNNLKNKMNKNGIMIVDDIFFHGDVFKEKPSTLKGEGVKNLLDNIKNSNYKKTILPISNGILMISGFGE